jgi:uroporphyrinogen decarboxylase
MHFEKPDLFPMMEFMGFWPETQAAWGNLPEVLGHDLFKHFGLVQAQVVPVDFNFVPAFEEKILEETDTHLVMIDATGCTKKIEKKDNCSSMPHYIDFPIKGQSDFEAIKERLDGTDHAHRYPDNWSELVDAYAHRDYVLGAVIRGPFAFCRDFVNFEQLMMMAYDDLPLVKEMMSFQVDFTVQLWDKLLKEVRLDYIYVGEDMAYKTGPMFSPAMLNELLRPLYSRLTDFFKGGGVSTIILDSDGDVRSLIDLYVESGFTCILPMERAAGMDPVQIRQQYPELRMIGGVDKQKIAAGGNTMMDELKHAVSVAKTGGYIPCFDHSVPPILSCQDYQNYLEQLSLRLNNVKDLNE